MDGPWTKEFHEDYLSFDEPLANALVEMFGDVQSVLDVGCGLGLYLKPFAAIDKIADGIEPLFQTNENGINIIQADIIRGNLVIGDYDVVFCLEVLEHIPRNDHDVVIDFLCTHAKKYVVFSGAVPNQGGSGHIAERPAWEWQNEFTRRTMVIDPKRTASLRDAAKYFWFRNNVLVISKS